MPDIIGRALVAVMLETAHLSRGQELRYDHLHLTEASFQKPFYLVRCLDNWDYTNVWNSLFTEENVGSPSHGQRLRYNPLHSAVTSFQEYFYIIRQLVDIFNIVLGVLEDAIDKVQENCWLESGLWFWTKLLQKNTIVFSQNSDTEFVDEDRRRNPCFEHPC